MYHRGRGDYCYADPLSVEATAVRKWAAFTHRTDQYAKDVLAGHILAGQLVHDGCERHLKDRALAARKSGHPKGWEWSATSADACIGFFEEILRLPDKLDPETAEEAPFLLEPPLLFIVGSLMGWIGPDGYRRFREAYVETGKGSGKTPLAAGLGLYGLTMDGELGAEIYAAAVTRDQAKICFRDAERMVDCSPILSELCKKTVNNIAYDRGKAFFRPYSRDQGVKSGARPHFALIDEVHEHPTPEVINKLRAGFKFRKQPLAFEITNSGFDRSTICWQHHEHAAAVLRGRESDDRLFAYVCQLDEGDNPLEDPSCWPKTNPLLNVTITEEYLERQVENAKNIPHELNTVLRLNFCVWTQQREHAINMGLWDACARSDWGWQSGDTVYAGLDLGQSDDFSALVLLRVCDDGTLQARCRFWLPEIALTRYAMRPYDAWRRMGALEVTEGDITDYDVIQDAVLEECEQYGVREVAYDKRFAQQLAIYLSGRGVGMVDTAQGFQLNEACKRLGELVATGDLHHGHHPILSWMAANLQWKQGRGGEIRPDKDAPGEKIDGMVALIMAISRHIAAPQEVNPYTADRGIQTITW